MSSVLQTIPVMLDEDSRPPLTGFHGCVAPITRVLSRNKIVLTIYAFVAGFMTYFSMYGLRKPFSVYDYPDMKVFGIEYKILIITFQVIGYTISKFAGIKIISELGKKNRGIWIVSCIALAELGLVGFGAIPKPWNSLFMIVNGLPLGLIWGLVFSFLEGRKTSEVLGSGMCVSFIVASGAVKSVGQVLLNKGIDPFWMPALCGAIFLVPLFLGTAMLECLPEPDEEDIRARTKRVSMTGAERCKFLAVFWPGIATMTLFYMFVTAYRDFRDNFAPELWEAFGFEGAPSIFSISEIIVAIAVCVPIGLFMLIKTNMKVFISYHVLIIVGMILTGLVALLFQKGSMSGLPFMVLTGIGLYVGYVPFNSIIYDLMIATFQYKANSGFLMYFCDSLGYLSSVVIMFVKNFAVPDLSWKNFYIYISYGMAGFGAVLMTISMFYYIYKKRAWNLDPDNRDNSTAGTTAMREVLLMAEH